METDKLTKEMDVQNSELAMLCFGLNLVQRSIYEGNDEQDTYNFDIYADKRSTSE